jgi:hypothetical protein
MRCHDLLNALAIFEREHLEHRVVGGLAQMLRAEGGLSERIEIAVTPTDARVARDILRSVWPTMSMAESCSPHGTPASSPAEQAASRRRFPGNGSETLPAQPAGRRRSSRNVTTRYLPADSPMYVDLHTSSATDDASERLTIDGVIIRVGVGDCKDDAPIWVRPGFTLRERIHTLNAFASDILPARQPLRGLHKYSSAAALFFDRHESAIERVAEFRRISAPN